MSGRGGGAASQSQRRLLEEEADAQEPAAWRSKRRVSRLALLLPPMLVVGIAGIWLAVRHPRAARPGAPPPSAAAPMADLEPSQSFVYHPKYACAVCLDMRATQLALGDASTETCHYFGSCAHLNSSVTSCVQLCADEEAEESMPSAELVPPTLNLRVAKGLGSKPYNLLRVSVITSATADRAGPMLDGNSFDYSQPFRYRWTHKAVHTSLVEVAPGEKRVLDVSGERVELTLPPSGSGVAGVIIADPCVAYGSLVALVGCTYGVRFELARRLPALLDAFVGANTSDVAYWAILGDNLYDRTGEVTETFFNALSVGTKSKPLMTVMGNHDFWALGTPGVATKWDQFGNGFMQWYAQDTIAADGLEPGDPDPPFDFSVDPDAGRAPGMPFGGQITAAANGFWFNQLGNVGMIGYSGAHDIEQTLPYLTRACKVLHAAQPDVRVLLLVGHWDVDNLGCETRMDVPGLYSTVAGLPGCSEFAERGALKFFMGHTHCNMPHPHGHVDTGFMVSGQGMEGCGNFGIPVVDTTRDRIRVLYFPIVVHPKEPTDASEKRYRAVLDCVLRNGWRGCTQHATTWLDQPLPDRRDSDSDAFA